MYADQAAARQRIVERAEKELAAVDAGSQEKCDTIGYGGKSAGCFPSAASLVGQRSTAPRPTENTEVSELSETLCSRVEVLHNELNSVEQRFSRVLRASDPQSKSEPRPVPMTSLGSRLFDALQGLDAAISRLRTIQELACL